MTSIISDDEDLQKKISKEIYLSTKRLESMDNQIKYNFGRCKICSDEATGIHYGISSCEGCKGFFKRSIPRYKKYVCQSNLNCTITPKQRKKCKYCRWMNCVKEGMSFKGIRMGRIPNSLKEKSLNNCEKAVYYWPPRLFYDKVLNKKSTKENQEENTYNNILSIKFLLKLNNLNRFESMDASTLMAKNLFIDYYLNTSKENKLFVITMIRDKSYQLFIESTKEFDDQHKRAVEIIQKNILIEYEMSPELIEISRKKDLIVLKKHAKTIIRIIKELPGFDKVLNEDLMKIINQRFFTILGLRTLKLFINDNYFLMLDNEIQLNKELMGEILGSRVRDIIFDYHFKLNSLFLTEQEIALLVPYFLTADVSNLKESVIFKQLNDYYCQCLFYEFSLNKRDIKFIENFTQLISKAPKMEKMCKDIELNLNEDDYDIIHV